MFQRLWLVAALLAVFLPVTPDATASSKSMASKNGPVAKPLQSQARQSAKFSNIWLTTQHGQRVRFYDDLVKDKVIMINLMYTTCTDICPMNMVQLTRLHELMKRRMGRDITMLSISIDPDFDSPKVLKQYWKAFGSKPGWLFLTGKFEEIERLRRDLGVYDLDPVIDADKSQHSGILTIGNDRIDRWLALPIMMHLRQLAMTIIRNTRDKHWTSRRMRPSVRR